MESKFQLIKQKAEDAIVKTVLIVAIYARFSSLGNSPLSAVEQILRILHRISQGLIRSKKYPFAKLEVSEAWIIKDEAVSGRTAVGREGYELIKSGIRAQKFDVLLTDDISRLSRDLGDTLDLWEALDFSGVEGISVSDGISTFDPNSKDLFIFKGYANEAQAKNIAKNTIRGMEIRILGGFSTGHQPYGYYSTATKHHLIKGVEKPSHFEIKVKHDEASVVQRIWALYSENVGVRAIATLLTNEGVPPPPRGKRRREKNRWSQQTVHNILNNEKYLGIWTDRKTHSKRNPSTGKIVQRPRPIEECLTLKRDDLRIVSEEIERRVKERQLRVKEDRAASDNIEQSIFGKDSNQPKHLFVGTLRCGECGGNMIVASGKAGGYFGCTNAYQHRLQSCNNRKLIKMSLLEQQLIAEIKRHIDRDETYEYIAKRYNKIMLQKHSDLPKRLGHLDNVKKAVPPESLSLGHHPIF